MYYDLVWNFSLTDRSFIFKFSFDRFNTLIRLHLLIGISYEVIFWPYNFSIGLTFIYNFIYLFKF